MGKGHTAASARLNVPVLVSMVTAREVPSLPG